MVPLNKPTLTKRSDHHTRLLICDINKTLRGENMEVASLVISALSLVVNNNGACQGEFFQG